MELSRNQTTTDFYPRSPRGERRCFASRGVSEQREFLSTLPARGATPWASISALAFAKFLSTLPARGATLNSKREPDNARISIHAPREGSDVEAEQHAAGYENFYPRSPRGERLLSLSSLFVGTEISIHAPREGSDAGVRRQTTRPQHFYPRSPRGERPSTSPCCARPNNFYPRSPRGERHRTCKKQFAVYRYFYPRSPRGERPGPLTSSVLKCVISIHAPREGSDGPRHRRRRAQDRPISIHAPREGSDPCKTCLQATVSISIHAPREGSDSCILNFNAATLTISIHAPREGSDPGSAPGGSRCRHFYPRSPRGERRYRENHLTLPTDISIHAPREGSDMAIIDALLS